MSAAERPLAGQFAAVTGGSKGIGLGIARRFVQAGASVVLLARTEAPLVEACDSLETEIRADEQVHWIAMDTSQPESIAAGFAAMAGRIPRLNVFVANAGSGSMSPFAEMSLQDWQGLVDLNLTGTFLTCQAAARRMLTEPPATTMRSSR